MATKKIKSVKIGEFDIRYEETEKVGVFKASVETPDEVISFGKTGTIAEVVLNAFLRASEKS